VTIHIRAATEVDLPSILEIYNEVIANTTAVYSERAVSLDDRRAWFDGRVAAGYPVLVAVSTDAVAAANSAAAPAAGDASAGTEVVGFASFGDFRSWPGYRHTVEHSVHVAANRRGAGIGRALISALLPLAAAQGKHVMIAGVDADNATSIHLHERLGFERVAHLRQVGRKFDRWLDLVFLQRYLG
jgi:phosphinothricin acetyltransferase